MSSAQLLPNVMQTWFNSNGFPLSGGQIFSYIAGTSTPQATYTDETAVTPNTNPVVLNSAGQAAVWLRTDLSYKIVVEDSLNNILSTTDNINIVNPGNGRQPLETWITMWITVCLPHRKLSAVEYIECNRNDFRDA